MIRVRYYLSETAELLSSTSPGYELDRDLISKMRVWLRE